MSWEIRTKVKNLSKDRVEIERSSKDFMINLIVDFTKQPQSAGSGVKFVDSLMEKMGFSVEISKDGLENRFLIENIGFALGEALRKLHGKRKAKESGTFIQSEKEAICMFAINAKKQGEANLQLIGKPKFSADYFFAFFDGFSQGFGSEVNTVVNLARSDKKHEELVSRAFGSSLEQMFSE